MKLLIVFLPKKKSQEQQYVKNEGKNGPVHQIEIKNVNFLSQTDHY